MVFTGLISALGEARWRDATTLAVTLPRADVPSATRIGDSVAVLGVCLTVVAVAVAHIDSDNDDDDDDTDAAGGRPECTLVFELHAETRDRTTLSPEDPRTDGGGKAFLVHVEFAAVMNGSIMHGHLVYGHVHGRARCTAVRRGAGGAVATEADFELLPEVPASSNVSFKGAVALDGVSLTVARVLDADATGRGRHFTVALVPHTLRATRFGFGSDDDDDATAGRLVAGAHVNFEPDMIGDASAPQWSLSDALTDEHITTNLIDHWRARTDLDDAGTLEYAMEVALDEARFAIVTAPPEPAVGAVLRHKNGTIVARAHTGPRGSPHAEAALLETAAKAGLFDVPPAGQYALFITLEPCHDKHVGGPDEPCVDIIARYAPWIEAVYYGLEDPDERERGRGIAALVERNVPCEHVQLLSERSAEDGGGNGSGTDSYDAVERFYRAHAHHRRTGRPYVTWVNIDDADLMFSDEHAVPDWNVFDLIIKHILPTAQGIIFPPPEKHTATPEEGAGHMCVRQRSVPSDDVALSVARAWASAADSETCSLVVPDASAPTGAALLFALASPAAAVALVRDRPDLGLVHVLITGGADFAAQYAAEGLICETIEWRRNGARSRQVAVLHASVTDDIVVTRSAWMDAEPIEWASAAEAVAAVARGELVLVADDEGRENETDIVGDAYVLTERRVAFMLRHSTGIICAAVSRARAAALNLPLQVPLAQRTDPFSTAFAVGVDASTCTTGVSAADRLATLHALACSDPVAAMAEDDGRGGLRRGSGHVWPLVARDGLLAERRGHTEAARALVVAATAASGLGPRDATGVLAELRRPDGGGMMRRDEARVFARRHGLLITTVGILAEGLPSNAQPPPPIVPPLLAQCPLTLSVGDAPAAFELSVFGAAPDGGPDGVHRVLVHGCVTDARFSRSSLDVVVGPPSPTSSDVVRPLLPTSFADLLQPPPTSSNLLSNEADALLVRVHSDCWWGDALGSLQCDCGEQLAAALKRIVAAGRGVIVFPAAHEGRGIGLVGKVRAYAAAAAAGGALDTYAANAAVGHAEDARDYASVPALLLAVGVRRPVRLLTGNPHKVAALAASGLLTAVEGLSVPPTAQNGAYLLSKERRHEQQQQTTSKDTFSY